MAASTSESNPPSSTNLKPGTFSPPLPTDLRSPCPAVNALANHGYLPRSGRSVTFSAIHAGMSQYSLSALLAFAFAYPIFYERQQPSAPHSWTEIFLSPIHYLLGRFGMRSPGETDPTTGERVLNLDQLAQHGIVEHDVSLSRRDIAQGDNNSPQPDLIAELLAASTDGKFLTIPDFVALRRKRYATQKLDNPDLKFGSGELQLASAEVALILKVFGDGKKVPVEYVKAFFQDGRLPREEGWTKKSWWSVGLLGVNTLAGKIKKMIGPEGESGVPATAVIH